ncbi:ATP-binding protein [Lamprobacter modestohalophilus]|uniref:AAA family ATPase n=1 Tax=Lamprobacter modestohalophilus TaxID=1064514 RepID=UPI002ADEB654|nr:ATP-binding protein [Lamprobacter modestohalophilus]MEA1052861.1 ATP-binding protein [Lamprobacter modestohalophilus]
MLHSFRFQNVYSFREDTEVSLVASERLRGSSLVAKREGFPALSKALAVMGANGSGKTNAIKVLAFLHWFIGHSFRAEPDEPIPFEPHFFAEDEPSEFELLFDTAGTIYRYELTLTRQRVIREALYHKTSRAFTNLFLREWLGGEYAYKQQGFGLNAREAKKARQNASLISTAAQYDVPLARRFACLPIHTNVDVLGRIHASRSDVLAAADRFLHSSTAHQRMEQLLRRWDLGLAAVEITQKTLKLDDGKERDVAVAYGVHADGNQRQRLELFQESSGTQRAFVLLSELLPVLDSGGLALIDEMESDLHPHMLTEVLNLFLNPSTNPKDAQIIFTTHTAEVLSQMQKPQVALVEKDAHCNSSLWRLSDVKGIRADDNLYAKYMAGAYGGVPLLQ